MPCQKTNKNELSQNTDALPIISRNFKAFNTLLKRDKNCLNTSTVRKTLPLQKVQIETKNKVC